MKSKLRWSLLAAPLALAACSNISEAPQSASAVPAEKPRTVDKNPYPSTYKAYPGVATAIRNVTIFDGEGGRIENGIVFFANGKVSGVGGADTAIPEGTTIIDGTGKFVTPGIIDIHSHLGDYPTPSVEAHSDGNEATSPTTPEVWAEHSVWPQDPGFSRALANGGVTALQVLPGSANLMGGRSVVLKNVYARTIQGMKFPDAPYGMKMACGENPKRVYGSKGRMPSTRMGNLAVNRQTWIKAQDYKKRRDSGKEYTRDLGMETLAGVLDGDISIQNHCYRADEMALVLDMAKEFGYKVSTFHHAVESYKIADLLRDNGVCSAVWADWWGFKMESYDAIPENMVLVDAAPGGCAIVHSDSSEGIQRLNQEAAKGIAYARRMGREIAPEHAIKWVTTNAAKALSIQDRTGSIELGKMADVVVWNGNPFSVYAQAQLVFVDGAMRFDRSAQSGIPHSDFLLGQPAAQGVLQ